jgi:hypothetical protein
VIHTQLCELLGIEAPIMQAPSLTPRPGLAAATASQSRPTNSRSTTSSLPSTARTTKNAAYSENVCSWTGACPFHSFLIAAQKRFLDGLRATSLADVIRNGAAVPAANPRGAAA